MKPTLFQFYDDLPASDRVIVQFSPISSRSIVGGGVLIPLGVELCWCIEAIQHATKQERQNEERRKDLHYRIMPLAPKVYLIPMLLELVDSECKSLNGK